MGLTEWMPDTEQPSLFGTDRAPHYRALSEVLSGFTPKEQYAFVRNTVKGFVTIFKRATGEGVPERYLHVPKHVFAAKGSPKTILHATYGLSCNLDADGNLIPKKYRRHKFADLYLGPRL